jgi:hypothetical protein
MYFDLQDKMKMNEWNEFLPVDGGICSSEMSTNFYWTLHSQCCENLKFNKILVHTFL